VIAHSTIETSHNGHLPPFVIVDSATAPAIELASMPPVSRHGDASITKSHLLEGLQEHVRRSKPLDTRLISKRLIRNAINDVIDYLVVVDRDSISHDNFFVEILMERLVFFPSALFKLLSQCRLSLSMMEHASQFDKQRIERHTDELRPGM
jgi:hypothetical protein